MFKSLRNCKNNLRKFVQIKKAKTIKRNCCLQSADT